MKSEKALIKTDSTRDVDLSEESESTEVNVRDELYKRGFVLKDSTDEIEGFNANYFAKFIKENFEILYAKDGFFYVYENGLWKQIGDKEFLRNLRNILQEPRFGVWKKRLEDEYVAALKHEVLLTTDLNPYRNKINLLNGMFDLDKYKLFKHNRRHYSTIQIPVEYDRKAECPRFLQFLDEVFEGDNQRIMLQQEWFGYLLTTETKAQKALILYGSGGNGKGVMMEILSLLIGEINISHIPLNELNKGFSRVCIFNKTANISSENETDGCSFNTQYFKAIVGEDTINAEQKGKPVFSFKPTVKMVFSMNSLPSTRDKSKGFFRRLNLLNFSAYFSEDNRDSDLKKKLVQELPGIFNWAIEGLKRLKENDYKFSYCKNQDKMLAEYEKEVNPMKAFFEECVKKVDDHSQREDNRKVYNEFKNWATCNGHKFIASISNQRFWREFETTAKELGFEVKTGRSNSSRYHTGIKIVTGSATKSRLQQFED
jgi:putative DNA primase/helicase